MELNFCLKLGIQTLLLFTLHYTTGLLVKYKGIKTNYTRKINHFALFFLPMGLQKFFHYHDTSLTVIISLVIGMATLGIYVKPFRSRFSVIATAFLAFDRPEDRPHTLFWLTTQIIAGNIVFIILAIIFSTRNLTDLLYIPLLINGIGDGLAEPVGVRFGRHKYKVYAFFSKKKYTRSMEGSACVFITSILIILAFRSYFSPGQFIMALVLIPILMTLAEAFAPHTWDSPILYFVAGVTLLGLLSIS